MTSRVRFFARLESVLEGRVKFLARFRGSGLFQEQMSEAKMGFASFRVQGEGFLKGRNGLVEMALLVGENTFQFISIPAIGLEAKSGGQNLLRLERLASLQQGSS